MHALVVAEGTRAIELATDEVFCLTQLLACHTWVVKLIVVEVVVDWLACVWQQVPGVTHDEMLAPLLSSHSPLLRWARSEGALNRRGFNLDLVEILSLLQLLVMRAEVTT